MTNAEVAEMLLRNADEHVAETAEAYSRVGAEAAGRREAARVWAEANPDDGLGFGSSNPYEERGDESGRAEAARLKLENARCIRDFVRNRVCACVA